MNTAITLDMTHLLVAGIALLVPILLKRLQSAATPAPPTVPPAPVPAPAAAPSLAPDVLALLPFHGALVNLVLKLLEQQTVQQPPQPTK